MSVWRNGLRLIPRTIRDRIHLVLRKKKEPVHFTDIAHLINEAKLDDRIALASTVHNELIKDPRFVLVGRGMYGLAEHGHVPGTAQEVIARILKREGPLKSNEIIQAVQKERLFKHNTILVNLQNKGIFERQSDGRYTLREA
jgi:predicted Zn-ribbon and HTH transcriptional regulator